MRMLPGEIKTALSPVSPVSQIVMAAGLQLLALISGDLVYWNVGPIGLVVLIAFLLPANLLLARGQWAIIPVIANDLTIQVLRLCLLGGIINIDLLTLYLILPEPMSVTFCWTIAAAGLIAVAGSVLSLQKIRLSARQKALRNLELFAGLLQFGFPFFLFAFDGVISANEMMSASMNRNHPSRIGLYVDVLPNAQSLITCFGFGTLLLGFSYCFLIERLTKKKALP